MHTSCCKRVSSFAHRPSLHQLRWGKPPRRWCGFLGKVASTKATTHIEQVMGSTTKQIRAEFKIIQRDPRKWQGCYMVLPSSHLRRSFCTISNGATKENAWNLSESVENRACSTAIWYKIQKSHMFHGRSHSRSSLWGSFPQKELHQSVEIWRFPWHWFHWDLQPPASWNPCETLGIVPPGRCSTSWKEKQILIQQRRMHRQHSNWRKMTQYDIIHHHPVWGNELLMM